MRGRMFSSGGLTMAGNLNVMASVAFKGVLERFEPEFRQSTGFVFAPVYAPAGTVVKRVRAGATTDVVVVTPETMKLLIDEGLAVAGSEHNIATSVVGVAVRAGAPRPKITTADDVRAALIAAKSVAYTDPSTGAASGVHFVQLLERFGIADAVKAKATLGDGGPVAEFVARGEAEIAIQQLCEHMLVPGVDVVGPLPDELNKTTVFTAGVTQSAAAPSEGTALVKLLLAPHVRAAMPSHGLTPV
jgi:molybdate transport system substrate-binding protein